MSSTVTTIKRTVPALLPATLVVFLLLPVGAEMPVSAELPFIGQVPMAAQMAVATELPVSAQLPVDAQAPANEYDYQTPAEYEAQVPYEGDGTVEIVIITPDELDDLIGPIALYPDDLLAIVLPASTYPTQISEAVHFLEDHETDPSLQPNDEWDESVTALLNYPEVLRMMYDDIEWTWKLGGAVLNQQSDVIEAVESFRDRAYAAGNLKSDEYQTVSNDEGPIEITPVNEEIIYVPYYEPERVVIRQIEPVYYYYPRPYPVYYYPYPADYAFSQRFFWGVTTAYGIGWSNRHLSVRHHSFWSHPYYGHSYYGHYYRQPSVNIYNHWYVGSSGRYSSNRYRDGDRWRPRPNNPNRPGNRPRVPSRNDRDGRDTIAIDTGVLASRPSNVSRPGNRLRDRNVDLSATRDGGDFRRDRDTSSRGGQGYQSTIVGQSGNVPVTTQRPRPQTPGADTRRPRDDIRFRDRPAATTATTREPVFQDRPGNDTRRPRDSSRLRDRPAATAATTREPVFQDRPGNVSNDTRRPRDDTRFRDRPAATTAAVREPMDEIRFRDRPNTADTRRPADEIRFRDRPNTTMVATRPDIQSNDASSNRDRRQTRRTVTNQSLPAKVPTTRPIASVRDSASRDSGRTHFRSETPVISKPAVRTRTVPVQREQGRRSEPQVQREQIRRSEPRAQREPARQTERSAAPAKPRVEESRKGQTKASKGSGAKDRKAQTSGRRSKQRK